MEGNGHKPVRFLSNEWRPVVLVYANVNFSGVKKSVGVHFLRFGWVWRSVLLQILLVTGVISDKTLY